MFIPLRIPRYDDPREASWGDVRVDRDKCHGCRLCVRACPARALEMDGKKARMRTTGLVSCIACGDCSAICPTRAIQLVRSYAFRYAYDTSDKGPLLPPQL